MSWILEKKLKRHQKLREQEERRRQRLEIFSTGSSTPASSSSKTLTWKEEPKESSSLNVTINSGAPGFSTPSKRRQCVRESPSPKRGDPLLQPQTVQPTPRSSAPSVATFRKFRLSLSDDDDDDEDKNNNDNNDTHKATRTAVGTHIKDCLDHSLSLSDDDEEKEEIRESRWKKSHKIKPSPIRMVFGSAFVKDAKKSYPVGGEDDDDDDSFGDRELQEFRRLLQTQKSSTNSTNPPFQTTRSVNKLPKKSMECMDDHVEEFTPTQNDSIQDSDEETHLPTPNNRGTMNDDDSSVDKELQAVTDKLHSPISVPHNPIALAKHEAQVHAAAVQSHFASPENYNRNKNDALWSDSEPEQEDVKEDSSPSGKGKRKRKRSGGERSSCKSLSAISKANKYTATVSIDFWDDNAVLQQYGNLLLDSQVDELKEELHPTLTDPKFGPFDLEPLVLEHKSTKQGHQVPKALNRYLAPFQQDGVKFIYKCLMDNMGCV